jgi:hypothetical protein
LDAPELRAVKIGESFGGPQHPRSHPRSGNRICMHKFIAGVTSPNTASIDSTKSSPVVLRVSLSVIG